MEITIKNNTCYYFEGMVITDYLDLDQIVVKDIAGSIYDTGNKGYHEF